MESRSCILVCFVSLNLLSNALRDQEDYDDSLKVHHDANNIACPVLSGLFKRGLLKPDEDGKVSAAHLRSALQATGASFQMAKFQAIGIAGYEADDPHQVNRNVGPMSFIKDRYLNIFTMHAEDSCQITNNWPLNRTRSGHPCNANTQFVQHGYSTSLRDTEFDGEDPRNQQRFKFWIGQELEHRPDLDVSQPVLLFEGMVRLLNRARNGGGSTSRMLSGDFSGEYSAPPNQPWESSNIHLYHPSVTEPAAYKALSAWQPLFAWNGWWVAFARVKGTTTFFTKNDLEGFFVRGEFPADWEARSWGFKTAFESSAKMKGHQLGEHWLSRAEGMLDKWSFGSFINETRLNVDMLKTLVVDLGIQRDDVHQSA